MCIPTQERGNERLNIFILMPQPANIWTEPFRVRTFETDLHGCASIQTLCNYFNEAAGKHALSYGVSIEELNEKNLTWVLSRLHVQVDAYPEWGDEVVVETWPSGIEGLFAIRDFLFLGAADGDGARPIFGRGSSAWIIVDLARKRPVRVAPLLTNVSPPERPRALDDAFAKLKPPPGVDHERRFRVRYSDLDVNRHVNNVRYAEWAVESVPEAVLHTCRLHALELQFRAEATYGDTVVIETQHGETGQTPGFTHRLVRESDARAVAVARTRWARRDV